MVSKMFAGICLGIVGPVSQATPLPAHTINETDWDSSLGSNALTQGSLVFLDTSNVPIPASGAWTQGVVYWQPFNLDSLRFGFNAERLGDRVTFEIDTQIADILMVDTTGIAYRWRITSAGTIAVFDENDNFRIGNLSTDSPQWSNVVLYLDRSGRGFFIDRNTDEIVRQDDGRPLEILSSDRRFLDLSTNLPGFRIDFSDASMRGLHIILDQHSLVEPVIFDCGNLDLNEDGFVDLFDAFYFIDNFENESTNGGCAEFPS